MEQIEVVNYSDAVRVIKSAILQSRYQAARLINREALTLYYAVGKYISKNSRNNWGQGAITAISKQLQQELPGLRGFSEMNIKRMRRFYEEWSPIFENRPSATVDLGIVPVPIKNQELTIRPLTTVELTDSQLQAFLSVPFTHHDIILSKSSTLSERLFYIEHVAKEIWSVEKLQYSLKEDLFHQHGTMPNNFDRTIPQEQLQSLTAKAFREEYQLDFLTIEDPDLMNIPVWVLSYVGGRVKKRLSTRCAIQQSQWEWLHIVGQMSCQMLTEH